METLLESFHLDSKQTSELLRLTRGIIAGSAPLSALKQTFTPNDIDIWVEDRFCEFRSYKFERINVPSGMQEIEDAMRFLSGKDTIPDGIDIDKFIGGLYNEHKLLVSRGHFLKGLYNRLLLTAGYERDMETEALKYSGKYKPDDSLYKNISNILTIERYLHPSGKNIQVIYIEGSPIDNLKQFDFDICRVYYDGVGIYSDYMEQIQTGVFSYIRDDTPSQRNLERKDKYISRGFIYKDPEHEGAPAKYDTLEGKTNAVYSFLAQKEIKTLIIIGEGGSGKSVATTAAIEKYKEVDPDIYNKVAIGYEGESRGPHDEAKGALTCPKEEQKNLYHVLQEDEDILAYELSKPTEIVYFVRGEEKA